MHLSIIIPAYNEADRLPGNLKKIQQFFSNSPHQVEIIVVDDGSTDGMVDRLDQHDGQIRIIRHGHNQGKGAGVRTGMLAAEHEWRLLCDADLSTPIEEFDKFLPYTTDWRVIIGSRRISGAHIARRQVWWKNLMGQLGNLLIQILATPGVRDTQCGFKLFHQTTRGLFAQQQLDGWGYDFEILWLARRAGLGIKEVPVIWYNDERTKVRPTAYLRTLLDLIKIHWYRWQGRYQGV